MGEHGQPDISAVQERELRDYMRGLAAAAEAGAPRLPDAKTVWLKAQLVRRWDAEQQAQRSLDVMERVQLVAGAAAAAVFFVWAIPGLLRSLEILTR